jgi:hypothetical protein
MVEPRFICIFNDTGEIAGSVQLHETFARVQALGRCLTPQTFVFTVLVRVK